MRSPRSLWRGVAACVVLGPLTGPLALRALYHWRTGARVLAALYVVTACMVWVDLPLILRGLLQYIGAHHS